jgi:hypothetical protein
MFYAEYVVLESIANEPIVIKIIKIMNNSFTLKCDFAFMDFVARPFEFDL